MRRTKEGYAVVDGLVLDPSKIESMRQVHVELRDAALRADKLDWSLHLSLTIAALTDYKERVETEEKQRANGRKFMGSLGLEDDDGEA